MTLDNLLADLQSARSAASGFQAVASALDVAIADVQAMRGGSSFPAWRQGLAVGVFTPITGSSLSASFNDSNAINDWTGLAADKGQWYAVCNGGHVDSSSNAVYKFDLTADAPKWVRLRATSPVAADAPTGYYSDGTPASRHTYNSPLVIGQRAMLFSAPAIYRNSYVLQNVDGFRFADNQFDPAGTFASTTLPASGLIAATWCKHPVTEDVYGGAVWQWVKWTKATNSWSLLPVSNVAGSYKGAVVDAVRHRIVLANHDKLTFIDLGNPTNAGVKTLALQGVASEAAWPNQWAVTHDTDLDAYYVGLTDGRVFKIDPVSGAASRIATLPVAVNGLQNRFAYFTAVKGIACYPAYAGPVYFLPTQ